MLKFLGANRGRAEGVNDLVSRRSTLCSLNSHTHRPVTRWACVRQIETETETQTETATSSIWGAFNDFSSFLRVSSLFQEDGK
jgi:hypothetical protein